MGVVWRPQVPLLISPEFEGIKTDEFIRCRRLRALLISPEFEGIKTLPSVPALMVVFATDQPRIRGD